MSVEEFVAYATAVRDELKGTWEAEAAYRLLRKGGREWALDRWLYRQWS
jgi:hypothetical protein